MGGSNSKENIVSLTAREHFIAHRILSKLHGGKLSQAFGMMCLAKTSKYNDRRYNVSSVLYENAKILISNARLGSTVSEETKQKIRNTTTGMKKSDATKAKMRKPKSKSHSINISKSKMGKLNPMYGKPSPTRGVSHSEETKISISENVKQATAYPPCPHCGSSNNKGNALRWHYDNCKHKEKNDSI